MSSINFKIIKLICLIVIIIISIGCINNNSSDVRKAQTNDLILSINLEKTNLNSFHNNSNNVSVKLSNNAGEKVKIPFSFSISTSLDFVIITPKNDTIYPLHILESASENEIILDTMESLVVTYDILAYSYYINEDIENIYNWNITGEYQLKFYYMHAEGRIYSNTAFFSLK